MRNSVGISMKKDQILIKISEKATYEEIIECLNKKVLALKKNIQSRKNTYSCYWKSFKK